MLYLPNKNATVHLTNTQGEGEGGGAREGGRAGTVQAQGTSSHRGSASCVHEGRWGEKEGLDEKGIGGEGKRFEIPFFMTK